MERSDVLAITVLAMRTSYGLHGSIDWALHTDGKRTVGDVIKLTYNDLLKISGIQTKNANAIRDTLVRISQETGVTVKLKGD
jgi:hypothetical protein